MVMGSYFSGSTPCFIESRKPFHACMWEGTKFSGLGLAHCMLHVISAGCVARDKRWMCCT